MDVKPLVKAVLARNHQVLTETMADVENAHAMWAPPGKALPLGALYIHILTGEDFFVNEMLQPGGKALWASTWEGKMGLSKPRPPRGTPWEEWARTVEMDMPKLRDYAQAVFAATDAYLETLTEADMGREIEFGGNKPALATFFINVMATHCANHTGEISTLKGLQGLKGYPF